MRRLIFGSGGHAFVMASVLDTDVTFVVPSEAGSGQILESEFFDRIADFRRDQIFIGVGSNVIRRRIFGELSKHGVTVSNCIAKHSFIARSAQIGAGVTILPGSVIGARAVLRDNTIVNTLSSIDHDCVLGAHSQVTAGVTFGGKVTTGENCFFGVKSAVIPDRAIGRDVVVMAGALVTMDVPDGVMVGGSPARVVKRSGPVE